MPFSWPVVCLMSSWTTSWSCASWAICAFWSAASFSSSAWRAWASLKLVALGPWCRRRPDEHRSRGGGGAERSPVAGGPVVEGLPIRGWKSSRCPGA